MSETRLFSKHTTEKMKKVVWELLFSSVGIYAFLYIGGMLAVSAKLNMLGLWSEVDLNAFYYVNETVRILANNLPLLLLGMLVGSAPFLLIGYVMKFVGYSLSWNKNRSISLPFCFLFVIYYSILLYFFLQPMGNYDLLFRKTAHVNDYLHLVINRNKISWTFYYIQVFSVISILLLLARLWSIKHVHLNKVYQYVKWVLTILFLIHLIFIPINYGLMISSKDFRKATVLLTADDIAKDKRLEGYLLIQTDKDLIFLTTNSNEVDDRLFIINREQIAGIHILIESQNNMLADISRNALINKNGGLEMIRWPAIIFLLLIGTLSIAFSERTNQKINTQQQTTEAMPSADLFNIEQMHQLFPILSDYLSKFGTEIETILENLQNILKGEEEVEKLPDIHDLNIWIYDIREQSFKQITNDGGYFSPRTSIDSQIIVFIKDSKLWKMAIDGKDKILVDGKQPYQRILGWDGASQYLLLGEDNKLLLLNTHKNAINEIELGIGRFKNINIDAFISLSEISSSGKTIYASKSSDNSWHLVEDRGDYESANLLIDDGNINLTPCWMDGESKVIYVSNRNGHNQSSAS